MHRFFASFQTYFRVLAVGASLLAPSLMEASEAARVIATATHPQATLARDLNADGISDVVIGDGAGLLQVVAGTSGGGYQTTGMYTLGGPITAIAAADVDADGRTDLIVGTSGNLYVLSGLGDGTFGEARVAIPSGMHDGVTALALGDLNGDGLPDLVWNDRVGITHVFLNAGTGVFQPAKTSALVTGASTQLALGNVYGSGHLDVVVGTANGAAVLAGAGDGSFGALKSIAEASDVVGLALADVSGAGKISVVLSEKGGQVTAWTSKAGAWVKTASATVSGAGVLAAGEWSADGAVQVAVAISNTNSVEVLSGVKNGTWQSTTTVDAGMPVSVLASSTSGDGEGALAFASERSSAAGVIASTNARPFSGSSDKTLQVASAASVVRSTRATPQGVTPAAQSTILALSGSPSSTVYGKSVTFTAIVSPGNATGTVAFYDGVVIVGTGTVNGGTATFTTVMLTPGNHLMTARYSGDVNNLPSTSATNSHPVTAALGTGFPTYQGTSTAPTAQPGYVTVGDVNNDGRQDAVLVNAGNNTVSVYLGLGNGTFGYPTTVTTFQSPYAAVVVDLNNDGYQDLAVSALDGVEVFRGNGTGTFAFLGTFAADAAPAQLVVGDFNRDNIPDLAIANSASTDVSILLGKGDGTFFPVTNLPTGNTSGSGTTVLTVVDYNQDGNPDLVAVDTTDGLLYLFSGNGNGTFQGVSSISIGGSPSDIASADFNGDGIADLVVVDSLNSQILVFAGNGNGTYQTPVTYPTGALPVSVAVSDFNGDGKQDVAVANGFDVTVSLFLGTGTGTFQPPVTYPGVTYIPGGFLMQVAAGEFNGDGAADLVVANAGDILGDSGMPGQLGVMLAGACSFSTSPTSLAYDSRGGTATVTIFATGSSCSWTAISSDTSWITLSSTAGTGTGSVAVTIAPNSTGTTRSGTITVGTQILAVSEGGTVQVFSDVPPTAYYFDAVNLLSQKGITAGCGTNVYCPTSAVTRAQMAIFIVRTVYNGTDNFTYSNTPYFNDVTSTTFGFQWIQKLYELGITAGCGNNNYCPDSSVTRDQMAIFIIRARYGATTNFSYSGAPYFTDVPTNDFAFRWIQRMKADAITSGCGPTTYCPSSVVTRGDMAIFIMRGGFNELLPPSTPVITAVTPSTIVRGNSATITVTGAYTNFLSGVTLLNTTAGAFTVSSVTVTSPTTFTAQITALPTAPAAPVSLYVVTGSQEAVLPNGLVLQ